MLFNSAVFLLGFLPVVLLVYYLLPHKWQNAFLVIASCIFYGSWDWRFLAPLLWTTGLDYWVARRMERSAELGEPIARRRQFLLISVMSNLGLLAFFKYFNFFVTSAQSLMQAFGLEIELHTLEIVLPVAISFYTFQALSYTIDVYRGEYHATRNFWDFFLALLYFPHLVAGPIQRASNLLAQVTLPRRIVSDQVIEGVHLILWGFFKKTFIADNLAPIVTQAFDATSPAGGLTVLGIYAFTFQIYCDFSGYTDIARGLAKLMGFEFNLNFNLPYMATNPTDFWRRWHISLSSWLRDYLYRSLGGNRVGTFLTYRNLMITMVLGGLWHGAAWNFCLWGAYHGTLLVAHRLLKQPLAQVDRIFATIPGFWFAVRWGSMFLLTCYGWLLFRAQSLQQVIDMTHSLSQPLVQMNWAAMGTVTAYVLPLLVIQAIQVRSGRLYFLDPAHTSTLIRVICYAGMTYCTLFLGGQPQSFVYFQF